MTENKTANNNTTVVEPNLSVEKIALNKVAYVGDVIAFDIVVRNTGDCDLGDVCVTEIFDADELEYVGHSDNATWLKSGNVFLYQEVLGVGGESTFTVWFKTLTNGTLVNNVTAKSNVTDETPGNNTTVVYRPDLSVVKIALNKVAYVGDVIAFDIVVRNTGDCDLGDVCVTEIFDADELEYVGHSDNATWLKSGNVFLYQEVLGVGGESTFTVWFKTLTNGTLVNNVTAKSNVTDETPGNNTTVVYRPDLSVVKIALNKVVYVGEQTAFTIVVTNTGDCDLGDVSVVEKSYDGLVFDSYVNGTGNWIRVGDVFVLDGVLVKGASASFDVVFNTTVRGNFTNVVVARSNVTENKTANNNTTVVEPDLSVVKIALNKVVYVGEQTAFTIVVTNTGDCDLGDVSVVEKSYDGLVFDSYVNGTGNWIRVGDVFVLDGVLVKGASASFDVVFNTTVSGNFTNVVVAKSNVTENKTSNDTTEVIPLCDVEIIKLVDAYVHQLGDDIAWTIIVKNNGPDDALNVYVSDILPNTLRFLDAYATKGSYADGIWSVGTLKPGEMQNLTLMTKATKSNISITNTAVVNTTTPETNTTNNVGENTTQIEPYVHLVIVKTASNSTPLSGEVVTWTITVTNNGPDVAENVVITDDIPDGLVLIDSETSWVFDSIAAGESVSVSVKTLVINTGSIVNVATVTTTSNNTGENKTNETIDVPAVIVEINKENSTVPIYESVDNTTDVLNRNDEPDDNVSVSYEEPEIISVFEPIEPVNNAVHYTRNDEPVVSKTNTTEPVNIPEQDNITEITNDTNITVPEIEIPPEVEDSNTTNQTTPDVVDDEIPSAHEEEEDTPKVIDKKPTTPDANKTPNKVEKQTPQHKHVDVSDKQTANPIAVLLLALISIVALQIKRKTK